MYWSLNNIKRRDFNVEFDEILKEKYNGKK